MADNSKGLTSAHFEMTEGQTEGNCMSQIEIPADRAINHGGEAFHQFGAKFAETFEIWGDLKAKDNILDIGCGAGRMAIGIGERFNWTNDLIGFDVIKADVDFCRRSIGNLHPNFQFHHVDAWNGHYNPSGTIQPHEVIFPAEDSSIDFAFATSVFTHMFRREVAHYLREIYRVLKPRGRLLTTWFAVTGATFASPRARFQFPHPQEDGSYIEYRERPEDVVGFRLDNIMELLAEAGFRGITFHHGDWSKTAPATWKPRHSQDLFVCRK